jgi:hypothetical protein
MKKLILSALAVAGLIGSAGAQTQLTGSLTNGLVANYPFHGDTLDYSGYENDFTSLPQGSYSFGPNRFGITNSAIVIESNSCLTTSKKAVSISGSNPRTFSFWIKNINLGSIISFGNRSFVSPGNQFGIGFLSSHELYVWGPWSELSFKIDESYDLRSWHQITYSYSQSISTAKAYIDGKQIASIIIYPFLSDQFYTESTPLIFGGGTPPWSPSTGSSISDLKIYNCALTSDQIATLFSLESSQPISLISQPLDVQLTATNSQTAIFSVGVTNGIPPYAYQWMKDGVDLTNQTNASLVLSNAGANTVGYYSCQVTDANSNSVISSNAALNIAGVPFWLWQGLLAYYPLSEDLNDQTIWNRDLVDNSGVQIRTNSEFPSGSAMELTTNGSYANTEKNIGISNNESSSFSFWYYSEGNWPLPYAYVLFVGSWGDSNNGNARSVCLDPRDGNVLFFDNDWRNSLSGGISNIFNTLHHVIVIYSGSINDTTFYVDGVKLTNRNDPGNRFGYLATPDGILRISRSIQDGFKGFLSNLRIYNRALSSNEVAALYALESTPPGPSNPQSISFPSIPSLTLTNGVYTLGATASSGLPVTYSIGDSTVAGITNGSLIPLGVGTTTVVASQAGDTNWMPAPPVTNSLIVSLAQQSFTPDPVVTRTYGSLPFGLTLPTNASGIAITPRIVSGPASLSGTNLILTGTGTVTVAYDAPGNSLYASNSVTNTFTVTNGPTNLKAQTITFKPLAAKSYGSAPLPLTASVKSGLPITYWSSNTNVAVISGTNAVITGAGQAVITAYQPGDGATYNPAPPVSASLIVNQAAQKITFKAPKTLAYGAAPALLNASSSVANLPVTITSSDVNVARITNSGTNVLLVPTGTGTITLTANQSGNANVTAATSVSLPVVITPGTQTITFSALGTNTYGASPITLSATSSAGMPVTFTSSAGNVASISGTTLTIAGAGSAKITASQSGNSLWAAAKPITQTLKIAKAPQSITFSITSSIAFTNGGLIPFTGTASSGLPLSYKSGNAKVLSIAGTNCLITGKGTTTVVATQAGGTNYLAAPSVTNTVTVQ